MKRTVAALLLTFTLGTVLGPGSSIAQEAHAGGDEELARARIEVLAMDGQGRIDEPRYVALVPSDQRWDRPAVESLVSEGRESPWWEVPAGRYRLVCDAKGYSRRLIFEAVELAAGDSQVARCRLPRLESLVGRVISASDGEPVAGAEVGIGNEFLAFHPRAVSALAQRFGSAERKVVADEEGRFALPAVPGRRWVVWIQADGFSPKLIRGRYFDQAVPSLGTVELMPGGGLDVQLRLPEDFPTERYKLMLMGPESGPALREDLPDLFWQRPLDADGSQAWPALAPGRYSLWLKAREAGEGAVVPLDLGDVEIRAGRRTRRVFEVTPGTLHVTRAWPDLALRSPHRLSADQISVLRWREGRVEEALREILPREEGYLVHLPGGCRPGDLVVVSTENLVSLAVRVRSALCARGSEPPTLRFLPRATLAGRLLAPEGSELPQGARLLLDQCADPPRRPPQSLGAALFTTTDEGRFEAAVPAACLEVTLHAGLFAPVRFAPGELEARETRRLGPIPLRLGAALLARIVSDTNAPRAGVGVELVPEEDLEAAVEASYRGERPPALLSAVSDDHGWVRFTGVEPGRVHLRLTRPEARPFFAGPYELHRGQEVLLEEVEWPDGGTLEVHWTIPQQLMESLGTLTEGVPARRGPAGADQATQRAEPVFEVRAEGHASCGWLQGASLSEEVRGGVVVFEDVPPGTWRVRGDVRLPRLAKAELAATQVEVFAGAVSRIELDTEHRLYRGIVTYAGAAVEGRLDFFHWLEEEDRDHRTHAYSDGDGTFEVLLPEPGDYMMRFQSHQEELRMVSTVPSIEVESPDEVLEIALPEGRIEGRVVDAEGHPVPGALVGGSAEQGLADWKEGWSPRVQGAARSGPRGRFVLEGLQAGAWRIQARLGELQSEPHLISLGEDEHRGGVELELGLSREPAPGGDAAADKTPPAPARRNGSPGRPGR